MIPVSADLPPSYSSLELRLLQLASQPPPRYCHLDPAPAPAPGQQVLGSRTALSNTSQASSRQASGESRLCTRAGGGENWWSFVRIYANHLIDTDNNMIIISAANR